MFFVQNADRITPAHAGKSNVNRFSTEKLKDHPRTRGEKLFFANCQRLSVGSPPHTRGKAEKQQARSNIGGITPAHAGKSILPDQKSRLHGDHPRTRGEKNHLRTAETDIGGSPPHTRGKAAGAAVGAAASGITPAHAGKSKRGRNRSRTGQDHPRTRGEKASMLLSP